MRRVLPAAAALVVAVACSSGESTSTASSSSRPSASSSSTSTTVGADLALASVGLTPVAPATAPTAIAARPGDATLYVTEQEGRVLAIAPTSSGDATSPTIVADLTASVLAGGERGLLGLAFSPDGENLYVHYTGAGGGTVVEELAFTPDPAGGGTADVTSRRTIFTLDQPQPNHNGGQLAFGPDGALYLGLGDGGGADDEGTGHAPEGNGQSSATLLGKIVRIDPASGAATAFVSGLRNPWRFSFDRETDDLWIGDVGQDAWEEITRVPAAEAAGANLGWPLLEGSHAFRTDSAPGTILPTFEISQASGACAVVGGHVYRGTRIPDLRGAYLFTDNCDGRVRALRVDEAGTVTLERDLGIAVDGPTTFGEGTDGELYVASGRDGIFRIDAA